MHVHARAFESDLAHVAILAGDASVFYEAYLQRKMALESEARADTSLELPVHAPAVSPRELTGTAALCAGYRRGPGAVYKYWAWCWMVQTFQKTIGFHCFRTSTRWSMSSTSRLSWFHRGRLWRQSRFHIVGFPGHRHVAQAELWRWSKSERLCSQNPRLPCSSRHLSLQTSESLGTALVRHVAQAELWRWSKSERLCSQNPRLPMFVTAPVSPDLREFGHCTCPPCGTGGNCRGGWRSERFFLLNPHHPCSSQHPSWRLL